MKRWLWVGALAFSLTAAVSAENWPTMRGPGADGYSSEKNVPLKWSATENVRWKVALPGPGNSTPIVWDDRVFLTQSLDAGGKQRALMCLDRRTGRLLWQKATAFAGSETRHQDNPYCSATPITDGERVIASFGSAGLVCYDFQGRLLWSRDLGTFEHIWGNAASPMLYGDLVILNCGPGERTFLLALDKKTGRDVWKVDEPGGRFGTTSQEWLGSWSVPAIARVNGADQLVMTWPDAVKAYEPKTGKQLWSCGGLTKLVYTSPVVSKDVVVAMSGYGGSALAVRTGGSGDVTATHRLWLHPRNPQRIGSSVVVGDYLYVANATGTGQCIDLKTGKEVWNERLGGGSWSSLVYADGRLYVTSLQGETVVFAPGPKLEILARNPLDERTLASMAVSQGQLFIRTYAHLWCIGGAAN